MVAGERLQQGKGPSTNAFPTAWVGRRAQGEKLLPPFQGGKDGMLREKLIPRGSGQCCYCTSVHWGALTQLQIRHFPLVFNAPGPFWQSLTGGGAPGALGPKPPAGSLCPGSSSERKRGRGQRRTEATGAWSRALPRSCPLGAGAAAGRANQGRGRGLRVAR